MRYELTDYEWTAIKPFLPHKPRGVPRVNDRRVLNGIFWVLRSGAPSRGEPVERNISRHVSRLVKRPHMLNNITSVMAARDILRTLICGAHMHNAIQQAESGAPAWVEGLSDKARRFCEEYIIDLNPTEAIAVGRYYLYLAPQTRTWLLSVPLFSP